MSSCGNNSIARCGWITNTPYDYWNGGFTLYVVEGIILCLAIILIGSFIAYWYFKLTGEFNKRLKGLEK